MAENENLASILVKSGLISIFTNSPIGYFSKFSNVLRSKNHLAKMGLTFPFEYDKNYSSGFLDCPIIIS